MTGESCTEVRLLLQAEADGELGPAEAARVAAHLQSCPDCAPLPARLGALSAGLRAEATYHAAPEALRAAVAALAPRREVAKARRWRWDWRGAVPFGAGLALAGLLMFAVLPRGGSLPDEVVAGHIRALQPGHLMDVASTDQHTVKPWFDGRLDFAPPVKDLREQGFPLEGGRLDYLEGRAVAVLIYGRRQHVIDVFIWPEAGSAAPSETARNGYNVVSWRAGGMVFWAVSDLEARELAEFAAKLRAS